MLLHYYLAERVSNPAAGGEKVRGPIIGKFRSTRPVQWGDYVYWQVESEPLQPALRAGRVVFVEHINDAAVAILHVDPVTCPHDPVAAIAAWEKSR